MNSIKELLKMIFGKEEEQIKLNARIEFRLNKNEKILIKKYCDFKNISASEFFRKLAMIEIDNFINEKSQYKNRIMD